MNGLKYTHMMYFADMLIIANDEQLKILAHECMKELEARRQRKETLEYLPRFPEV